MDQSTLAVAAVGDATASAGLSGPFVVNLCASLAPIELKGTTLPGLERYRVYQVRRIEDDRPRFRLRLGFFPDEASTEAVLDAVREKYPAAFCVQAGSDDLKHAPGFELPKKPVTARAAVTPAKPVQPAQGTNKPSPSMPPGPARPAAVVTPAATRKPTVTAVNPTLELLPDAVPAAQKPVPERNATTPFRVQAADPEVLRSTATLELETGKPGRREAALHLSALKASPGTAADIPLDSTQTLRVLTEAEIADDDGPKWYVVQLAMSEAAINLEAMPKLDIFSAFRLYSIASPKQGKIQHSLRLGFFREDVSAEAVAGYLKTFFPSPAVMRVSNSEHTRFAVPLTGPRPPVLHTPALPASAKVVPLHEARARTAKAPTPATTTSMPPRVAAPPPSAPAPRPAPSRQSTPAGKVAVPATRARKEPRQKRSLDELLREEARQVVLSESGIRSVEKRGLLSRLVGKLTN